MAKVRLVSYEPGGWTPEQEAWLQDHVGQVIDGEWGYDSEDSLRFKPTNAPVHLAEDEVEPLCS